MAASRGDRTPTTAWERQMTYSDMTVGKGLTNQVGENNCFLNSAVQVLWHLDTFRRRFRTTELHACTGIPYSGREVDTCIFCALKVLFAQFQFSDYESLPPDPLRNAMAGAFVVEHRFQLKVMEDAAECFERILSRLHYHLSLGVDEDTCSSDTCIAHQQFAMRVTEKTNCLKCGSEASTTTFMQMIVHVSTSALVSGSSVLRTRRAALKVTQKDDLFGRLLKHVTTEGETKYCPLRHCRHQMRVSRTLTNCPDFVTIGLTWDSENQTIDAIRNTLAAISSNLKLSDMFDNSPPEVSSHPTLSLVAMVCYYGKHYSAFLYRAKKNKWVSADDTSINDIGCDWKSVVDKCVKGRYLPVLLVYGTCDAGDEQNPANEGVSTGRNLAEGQDGAKGKILKDVSGRSTAESRASCTSNSDRDHSETTNGQRKRSERTQIADAARKINCSRHPSYVSAIKSTSSTSLTSGNLDRTSEPLISSVRPSSSSTVDDTARNKLSLLGECRKGTSERETAKDRGSRTAADLCKWIQDTPEDDVCEQYIDPSLVANVLRCRQMAAGSNLMTSVKLQSRKRDTCTFGARETFRTIRQSPNEDFERHRQTLVDCELRIETSDIDRDSGISGDRNSASSTSSGHSVESSLTSLNSPVDFGTAGDRTSCSSSTMSCSSSLEQINNAAVHAQRRSKLTRTATEDPPIIAQVCDVLVEQLNEKDRSRVATPLNQIHCMREFGEARPYSNIDDWCSQVLLDADGLCVLSCEYENSSNMKKALEKCEWAIDLLKTAEHTSGVSQDMLIRLRMKRNAVVLTSRRLQRLLASQFHYATPSAAPSEYVRPSDANQSRAFSTHLTKEEVGEILVEEIEKRRNLGNSSGALSLSLKPAAQSLSSDRTLESQAHLKYKDMLRRQLKTFPVTIQMENCDDLANEDDSSESVGDWTKLRRQSNNAYGTVTTQSSGSIPSRGTHACYVRASSTDTRRFPHSVSDGNIRHFAMPVTPAQPHSCRSTDENACDKPTGASTASTQVFPTKPAHRNSVPNLVSYTNGNSTIDCRKKKTVTFSDSVRRVCGDESDSTPINVLTKTCTTGILKNSTSTSVGNCVTFANSSAFVRSGSHIAVCDSDGVSADESEPELDEVSPAGRLRCGLCRRNWADIDAAFCANCSFYMSKFQPTAL